MRQYGDFPMLDAIETPQDISADYKRNGYAIKLDRQPGYVKIGFYGDRKKRIVFNLLYGEYEKDHTKCSHVWDMMQIRLTKDNLKRVYQAARLMARGVNPNDAMLHALYGLSPEACRMLWEGFAK